MKAKALFTLVLVAAMPLSLLAQNIPSRKTHFAQSNKALPGKTTVAVAAPEPAALTPAELSLAERVYVGHLPCELGASVSVEADAKWPGYFHVQLGKSRFHMMPVATSTGAIRLEDRHAGTVWLQLANKSMMVSDKLGKRLVDACMNPSQVTVAQAMEKNPTTSVLDAITPPTILRSAVASTDVEE